MKSIFILKSDDKILGRYRTRIEAGIASDAYFDQYGVRPLLVETKIIGFATR